ncbi:MAG TPA: D-sedoheptulose 7-phosphate isomerase [Longimicrobium sp.]|jgi:D-sedoheptulose 7-phosphate isomerase
MDAVTGGGWAAEQVEASIRAHEQVRAMVPLLEELAGRMAQVFRSGGRVYFFGNGGSAADAQHWAAELSGRFYLDRPGLPAFALTTNTSEITAIGNDFGYELTFARPLSGMAREGDMAVGISTSGNSPNVVRALEAVRGRGVVTVGFTGAGGGAMAELCDICVRAPSTETPRIQEVHELCGHVVCGLVERLVFPDAVP